MSDFLLYSVAGAHRYPLVARDKGDITNRMKCSYEQGKNKTIYAAKAATIGAGAAAAGYGVLKSPAITSGLASVTTKLLKLGGKALKSLVGPKNKLYTQAAKFFKKLPTKAKAVGLIALPAFMAISYLGNKMIYKAGQIDQKYTDKALMEQKLKDAMIDF